MLTAATVGLPRGLGQTLDGLGQTFDTAKPGNPSPFNTLEETLSLANRVADAAEALADRLCGTVPEDRAAAGDSPLSSSDGLFWALSEHQAGMRHMLARIAEAHARINRQLP